MAFITNTDSSILPYNDDDMKYDLDRRQYVLTVDGFERWSGLKLSSFTDTPSEGEAFLLEISDDVYEYIYETGQLSSIKYKRYLIAKESAIREDFKKALMSQARYGLRSGANILKDQHGISIEKGKALDINVLRGNVAIASNTQKILHRIGLTYSGYYTQLKLEEATDY